MARAPGFAYIEALSPAIATAMDRLRRDDPGAFLYRGQDLQSAVERLLYYELAGDRALAAAWREGGSPPRHPTRIATAVADVLWGGPRHSGRGGPNVPLARLRRRALAAVDRISVSAPAAASDGPVLFVLDVPKYMRFIAPVREALGDVPSVVACVSGAPDADVIIDQPDSSARLQARSLGHGLWQVRHLAAGYDVVADLVDRFEPCSVVVVEGGGTVDALAAAVARAAGIPSICLQQGWSPIVHAGFRRMPYDRFCAWGEGFADLLRPWSPRTTMVTTGSPVVALPKTAPGTGVGVFLQPESSWIEAEHVRLLLGLARRVAREHPETPVLVREHPAAPLSPEDTAQLSESPNVELVPPATHPLQAVLERSALAVSIYSTTLIEAAALGRPAVSLNPTTMSRLSPDLEELGCGIQVRDADMAASCIGRLLRDPQERARTTRGAEALRQRFFAGADGSAPTQIAAVVASGR